VNLIDSTTDAFLPTVRLVIVRLHHLPVVAVAFVVAVVGQPGSIDNGEGVLNIIWNACALLLRDER
jgi:hypothetical protein